ncbi:MAG: sensor histidine kinase [Planctomycetaceae bacterium]|nr:sensor histidine kinase [Planctomycetaceae bacterium]MCP4461921.1 sensor histidine kinase [Planctomycetaceae bacterium]
MHEFLNTTENDRRSLSVRQLWIIALATLFLAIVLGFLYWQQRTKEWQIRVEQSRHRLDLAQEIVSRDLSRVRADLLFMAELDLLRKAQAGNSTTLASVAECFANFLRTQDSYSQTRLIDRTGREIVRVDWDGNQARLVPTDELQDKSDRYYVSESLMLGVGDVFMSDFDLNQEQGEIEEPVKPVIRLATPVPSPDGVPGDLLVFNYQGASLLAELAAISLPGRTYLVREDGHFLLGPRPQDEWGWILGHSATTRSIFPESHERLMGARENHRAAYNLEGCLAASPLDPAEISGDTQGAPARLKFVSYMSPETTFQVSSQLLSRLALVGAFMLFPLIIITRFWAAAVDRREAQNQKIAESEKRLRELSSRLVDLQEGERRAISREIHDSLGQQATAINLDLRMLREKFSGTERDDLKRVIHESEELLANLHGFATRVRPAELDDLGLKEALESHVWEFESRTGIPCEMVWEIEGVPLADTVGENVFRLIQEALNNIMKHADATVVSIQLKVVKQGTDRRLAITITDDGVGLQTQQALATTEDRIGAGSRLGMLGMRERVELLNGQITVANASGDGTIILIQIPIEENLE